MVRPRCVFPFIRIEANERVTGVPAEVFMDFLFDDQPHSLERGRRLHDGLPVQARLEDKRFERWPTFNGRLTDHPVGKLVKDDSVGRTALHVLR